MPRHRHVAAILIGLATPAVAPDRDDANGARLRAGRERRRHRGRRDRRPGFPRTTRLPGLGPGAPSAAAERSTRDRSAEGDVRQRRLALLRVGPGTLETRRAGLDVRDQACP